MSPPLEDCLTRLTGSSTRIMKVESAYFIFSFLSTFQLNEGKFYCLVKMVSDLIGVPIPGEKDGDKDSDSSVCEIASKSVDSVEILNVDGHDRNVLDVVQDGDQRREVRIMPGTPVYYENDIPEEIFLGESSPEIESANEAQRPLTLRASTIDRDFLEGKS